MKKATLVDIRSRRFSGAATPKSERGGGLSLGRGRLDAPEALKILDQGMKRRQLKRSNTNGSTESSTTAYTNIHDPMAASASSQDRSSSPEGTTGASSSEGEEIITPTDKPFGFTMEALKPKGLQRSESFSRDTGVKLSDGAFSALGKAPPSNSPYTQPLTTIPSQSALPVPATAQSPLTAADRHHRKSSDLAALTRRLSDLQDAHADHTARYIGQKAPAPESTRFSLIELLNEYEREDERLSQEGRSALDKETREHITRTLSQLEGRGSPQQEGIDNEKLLTMFGHLRRGLERAPKATSFVEDAAMAQKFLDPPAGVPQPLNVRSQRTELGKPSLQPIEPVASKWSESTSSDKGISPTSDRVFPANTQRDQGNVACSQQPTRAPPEPPRSIGYPSRIPNKANVLIGPGEQGPATPRPVRRTSSPTLGGQRKPGSVKAARETMHQMRGGFARTTASAESKKTTKTPASSHRALSTVNEFERGRVPSAEKSHSKSDVSGVPKVRVVEDAKSEW